LAWPKPEATPLRWPSEIYAEAYAHREELCAPTATVMISTLQSCRLPTRFELDFRSVHLSLRHVPSEATYNSSLRQLLHVASRSRPRWTALPFSLLEANEAVIAKNVTGNLYNRTSLPSFSAKWLILLFEVSLN